MKTENKMVKKLLLSVDSLELKDSVILALNQFLEKKDISQLTSNNEHYNLKSILVYLFYINDIDKFIKLLNNSANV